VESAIEGSTLWIFVGLRLRIALDSTDCATVGTIVALGLEDCPKVGNNK
jgi:hypothetical protein